MSLKNASEKLTDNKNVHTHVFTLLFENVFSELCKYVNIYVFTQQDIAIYLLHYYLLYYNYYYIILLINLFFIFITQYYQLFLNLIFYTKNTNYLYNKNQGYNMETQKTQILLLEGIV